MKMHKGEERGAGAGLYLQVSLQAVDDGCKARRMIARKPEGNIVNTALMLGLAFLSSYTNSKAGTSRPPRRWLWNCSATASASRYMTGGVVTVDSGCLLN